MPSTGPGTDDTEVDKRKWRHLLMCKAVGLHLDSIYVLNPTTIIVFCTVYISVKLSTNSSLLIDFHPSLHFCHYLLSCSFLSLKKPPSPPPRPAPFLPFVSTSLQGMKFSFLFDWKVLFWQAIFPGYKFQSGRISLSPNIKDVILLSFSFYCFFWGVFCLIFSPMKVMCLLIWQLLRFPFALKVRWSYYDASGCCFPCIGPTCI